MTLKEMRDRRDDAQSQLDALCGECPDVGAELRNEIAELTQRIGEAAMAEDGDYRGPRAGRREMNATKQRDWDRNVATAARRMIERDEA